MPVRCAWADLSPALGRYHDREWGRPIRGDAALFDSITLEGAQAGLSWATILNKRPAYRKALRSRGFTFVGPTVAESLLQAIGAMYGHVPGCAQAGRSSRSRSPRTRGPARGAARAPR